MYGSRHIMMSYVRDVLFNYTLWNGKWPVVQCLYSMGQQCWLYVSVCVCEYEVCVFLGVLSIVLKHNVDTIYHQLVLFLFVVYLVCCLMAVWLHGRKHCNNRALFDTLNPFFILLLNSTVAKSVYMMYKICNVQSGWLLQAQWKSEMECHNTLIAEIWIFF